MYDRILGEGRTGVCMIGKDHTSKKCFAVKKSKPKIIDLMMKECAVLSHLKPHSHIISFLGAVIDNQDSLLECSKMFMELAESKYNLILCYYKPYCCFRSSLFRNLKVRSHKIECSAIKSQTR